MVSDLELVTRLREILSTSDLNTTTTGTVRRQLEGEFGVDLSDRKRFISEQIDEYLERIRQNGEGEEQEEDGDVLPKEEEEDEEDEESDEAGKGSDNEEPVKKKRGGFTKICNLSPQLQEFVGVPILARTEVVKKLWAYIRENDLQDPSNKRNIICDEKLQTIFRVDTINMFQMNKALSNHIWPLDANEPTVKPEPKEKQNKRVKEDRGKTKTASKKQRTGNSGLLTPIPMSDALINFIGTGETELSRADVVKRIWDYIKKNELQDPSNKRIIICDGKLKELLNVDSFLGFGVTKLLTCHFIKSER